METEFFFEHQSNKLSGTLHIPKHHSSAAIIMVQGSGPADRNNDSFFPPIRDFFLGQGYSVLCYDRPGVGESTGNWKTLSFQDRASEVLAAVEFLQARPEISTQKIGLFGHSQGGWIVFLAASQSEAINCVISNSGPANTPAEQDKFGLKNTSLQMGKPKDKIDQALALHAELVSAAQKDLPFEQASQLIREQTNSAWEKYFSFDASSWVFFKKNYNYDPIPALRGTKCPSLVLLGGNDKLVPAEECVPIFRENLKQSDCTIKLLSNANHRMKVGDGQKLDPAYFEILEAWLDSN